MLIIGLTGGLASGKSTVASLLSELGAKVIDADRIAHQLIEPKGKCFSKVVRAFGQSILKKGRIDRSALAGIIFAEPAERIKLESMIHPQVRVEIQKKIEQYRKSKRVKVVVLDIPLLFESHWHRQVDATIVVSAFKKNQIERAQKHLKISRQEALKRMEAQMPLREKEELADYVVKNNGTRLNTKKQVQDIYREILNY